MINNNKNIKLALQHNLKYIKLNKKNSKKILLKNYSLYIHNNKIILNHFLNKKLLNV